MRRRYRYDLISAREAGINLHPQKAILLVAPDASKFEPAPIGDCWFFTAEEIRLDPFPDYLDDVTRFASPEEL